MDDSGTYKTKKFLERGGVLVRIRLDDLPLSGTSPLGATESDSDRNWSDVCQHRVYIVCQVSSSRLDGRSRSRLVFI